jgi:hypothetical protein
MIVVLTLCALLPEVDVAFYDTTINATRGCPESAGAIRSVGWPTRVTLETNCSDAAAAAVCVVKRNIGRQTCRCVHVELDDSTVAAAAAGAFPAASGGTAPVGAETRRAALTGSQPRGGGRSDPGCAWRSPPRWCYPLGRRAVATSRPTVPQAPRYLRPHAAHAASGTTRLHGAYAGRAKVGERVHRRDDDAQEERLSRGPVRLEHGSLVADVE